MNTLIDHSFEEVLQAKIINIQFVLQKFHKKVQIPIATIRYDKTGKKPLIQISSIKLL